MKFKHSHWILGVVVILLIAGAIGLSPRFSQTTAADPSLRLPLNPAGLNSASGSQQADTGNPNRRGCGQPGGYSPQCLRPQ